VRSIFLFDLNGTTIPEQEEHKRIKAKQKTPAMSRGFLFNWIE